MIGKSPFMVYSTLEEEALKNHTSILSLEGHDITVHLFVTDYDEATGSPVIGYIRVIDFAEFAAKHGLGDIEWTMYSGSDVNNGLLTAQTVMRERSRVFRRDRANREKMEKAEAEKLETKLIVKPTEKAVEKIKSLIMSL